MPEYRSYTRLYNFQEAELESDRKHWVSVAAAIIDGDLVLATRRRDNGKWEPPGGTLEPDETVIDGLRREIHEETGMIIGATRLSGIYKNMSQGIVALVFRAEHDGSQPKPTEEVAEFKWMTKEEVERNLDPAYACRLIDALKNESTPTVRSHDGTDLL